MDSDDESHDYLPEAIQILNTVKDLYFTDRPEHVHPYKVLTALIEYAPSTGAKREIARDIVENANQGDLVQGLTDLTDYWWTSLLVPCNILHFILDYLWKVRAQGGKSQPPADHPSRHLDLEHRMVTGRLDNREKVYDFIIVLNT